jgi:UDP-N-acetylglucosamine 1-carboxyvinyltransferase
MITQVKEIQKPCGEVFVSGAKNSATRMMAAAMLSDEVVILKNFPVSLVDVQHKARFMEELGCTVDFDKCKSTASLKCSELTVGPLSTYDFPIRTTYLLAAAQLHRAGEAYLPYPGGCKLGERKYDLHLMVWEKLGCEVVERQDYIYIKGTLKGGTINFPITTVGGTENALLCSVVAKGQTRITNAYITPEIGDLISLLRQMGAQITLRGQSCIDVIGVEALGGATLEVMSDRIEALTWMVYAAISGGSLLVHNVPFQDLQIPLIHLREAGVRFLQNESSVLVAPSCIDEAGIQPFEVACGTHPGVISDMQPFYVLLALFGKGRSLVIDYRYPERTKYLEELSKFFPGSITWSDGKISIKGPATLQPAHAVSTDLRGSMALLLAALLAGGDSTVDKSFMALRGYDSLKEKLEKVGVFFAELT